MVNPGRLTKSQLVEVEPGVFLGIRAARAYRRTKAAFFRRGKTFKPVNKYSGYRDKKVQNGMANASRTPPGSMARAKYNLSASSTIPVSYDPLGSHQDGRGLDFLINGSSGWPSESDRKLLERYGWRFQFGKKDDNHVRHNNIQGTVPVTRAWCIKNHLWVKPLHKK